MGREFSQNTANVMSFGVGSIGTIINGAAKLSFHAIIKATEYVTSTNKVILYATIDGDYTEGLVLYVVTNILGVAKLTVGGRSVSSDGFQLATGATSLTAGTEYSVGGVLDISGDTVRVYLNGAQDASTGVTFGNTTWTKGTPTTYPDRIGANMLAFTFTQWYGAISEVSIWTDDIGTPGFLSLHKRASPLIVRPDALVFYAPLIGKYSPETDIVSGLAGTITGSLPTLVHPRIFRAG